MKEKRLRRDLEVAASDIVYASESDRPFEWFFLDEGAEGWPYDGAELAKRLGIPTTTKIEKRSLDDFFRRHIETSDPYDVRGQQIRPRCDALKDVMRSTPRHPRVVRILPAALSA